MSGESDPGKPSPAPDAPNTGQGQDGVSVKNEGKPDPEQKTETKDDKKPVEVDDTLPEKFLRDGQPDYSALTKSYKELERVQFRRRDEIKAELEKEIAERPINGLPASPADYKAPSMKTTDGRLVEFDHDAPMFKWFRQEAHRAKMPQQEYERFLTDYMRMEMGRGPNWTQESEQLGPRAEDRLSRVEAWAQRSMPDPLYQVFAKMPASAGMVQLFEHVMTLSGEPGFALDTQGAVFNGPITKDALKAMQADPKYWREKDPVFVQQVRAGFKKLVENRRSGRG